MTAFDAHREHLMRHPRVIVAVEDTDPDGVLRGEVYGNTDYDVSVCWSRAPAGASHGDHGVHCVWHGDVRLDDPNYVLIGKVYG